MAKYKRLVVGSVLRSKEEGKPNYIKLKENVAAGTTLSVESKKVQLDNLERAIGEGKLSEELGAKRREQISRMPDWVVADLVQLIKNSEA